MPHCTASIDDVLERWGVQDVWQFSPIEDLALSQDQPATNFRCQLGSLRVARMLFQSVYQL
jgi:hypothetical protein